MRHATYTTLVLVIACVIALGGDYPSKGGHREDPYDIPVVVEGKLPPGIDTNAVNWMTCSTIRSASDYRAFPWTGRSAQKPHLVVSFKDLPRGIAGQAFSNPLFPATTGSITLNSKYRWSYFGDSGSFSLQSTLHHEVMHLIHRDSNHKIMKSMGVPEAASYSLSVLNLWSPKKVQK